MIELTEILLGLIIISLLAFLAFSLKSLDLSGMITGIIIGFFILVGLGWPGLFIIMVFFLVAAISTRLKYDYKRSIGFSQEKGGARGWKNTFANGGVAAISAYSILLFGEYVFAATFLGALATTTADTLATEIGLLSKSRPRLITNLYQKVGAGTSGGISLIGEIMVILSCLLIGISSIMVGFTETTGFSNIQVITITIIGGLVGAHFDSFLGATVQGMNKCVVCGIITESGTHHGKNTLKIKRLKFIGNNFVNFISTIIGAVMAGIIFFII
jgi:uncharacterized protein (TIGR00297 family)